jgi:Holliday junction resolvase RusA-like endonuclease
MKRTTTSSPVFSISTNNTRRSVATVRGEASRNLHFTLPWDVLTPDNRRFHAGRGHVLTGRYRQGKEAIYLLALSQTKPPRPVFPTEHLEVNLTFFMPDKKKRDPTNLLKGLLDALEGVVYNDDKQIDALSWRKVALDRENPRVEITAGPLAT